MKSTPLSHRGLMLITCPDQPGIIAAVSSFLAAQGANIVHSDQHSTDHRQGHFFMRVEFDLPDLSRRGPVLEQAFLPVAERFQMDWRLSCAETAKRMVVFVSREEHCLLELLWQWRAGDFRAEIVGVVSNHPDLKPHAESMGIPFHHIPVAKEKKAEAEAAQLALLNREKVDLVVLARYMQIISPNFIARYPNRIINIHHSFLPAFVGAKPYAQAYERGVKLIGATAHYVTAELDAGPIIEQDVQRVDHRSDVEELKRIGRHVERVVLARAVAWHLEDRVLVHGNKTVVFS
ncbi:MAG: formyltetrahydrofolate deformylase [Bacillota bacterium]